MTTHSTHKKPATRKIVRIDESKCNGCGLCVPSCAEGAIRIIDGKARLVADNLCDGLGNCLGRCPLDAITIEERLAEEFDEGAVEKHLAGRPASEPSAPPVARPGGMGGGCPGKLAAFLNAQGGGEPATGQGGGGGCPGSQMRKLRAAPAAGAEAGPAAPARAASRLGQWPVQLALVPVQGEMWQDADVLIAADCVAFAMGDFHQTLLAGKTLAIACPKLDDSEPYVRKLAAIFAANPIRSITVAHMEVPCCTGIVRIVHEALRQAGAQIPLRDVTVGIDGTIQDPR